MSSPYLSRRHFLAALAASVVAAGAALPIGFPKELKTIAPSWVPTQFVVQFGDLTSAAKAYKKAPWLFLYEGEIADDTAVRQAA